MPHNYSYNVTMPCSGCSGAVTRALSKLGGVTYVDASLETQTVNVTCEESLDYDTVYNVIAKTGKRIISGRTVS